MVIVWDSRMIFFYAKEKALQQTAGISFPFTTGSPDPVTSWAVL
jgi:hypothetical protein